MADEGRHRTLARGFQILEVVAESSRGMGVSEIAAATGLDRSTVSRMIGSLEAMGYLVRAPDRTLVMGGRILRLSEGFHSQFSLEALARPALESLRDATGETAILVAREGSHSSCIDQADPQHQLRMVNHTGLRTPLHATAGGRAILFSLPDAEQLRILEECGDEPVEHPEVNLTFGQLTSQNTQARRLGYVHIPRSDDIERVAAVILDAIGEPLGAVTVYGPKYRMQGRIHEIGLTCRQAAHSVSTLVNGD